MTRQDLPPPDLLRKLLRYEPDTGKMFWLSRSVSMFAGGVQSAAHNCASWNARFAGKEAFTTDGGYGYRVGMVNYAQLKSHRVAWALHFGFWPAGEIDHINGIRDDNRIANLRDVNTSTNQRNAKMRSHNTSGHNGVSWNKRRGKWVASIRLNGRQKNLGYFYDINSAVSARKAAEVGHGFTKRHGNQWRTK